jgi:hypothetical protein
MALEDGVPWWDRAMPVAQDLPSMARHVGARVLAVAATLLIVGAVVGGVWVLVTSAAAETAVGVLLIAIVVGGTVAVGARASASGRTPYW